MRIIIAAPPEGDTTLFDAYDKDGDGVVSPKEWMAGQGMTKRQKWVAEHGDDSMFDM